MLYIIAHFQKNFSGEGKVREESLNILTYIREEKVFPHSNFASPPSPSLIPAFFPFPFPFPSYSLLFPFPLPFFPLAFPSFPFFPLYFPFPSSLFPSPSL